MENVESFAFQAWPTSGAQDTSDSADTFLLSDFI